MIFRWMNISPYNQGNQFELKMRVNCEDLWKSKQYLYRISGTFNTKNVEQRAIFGGEFKNVGQSEITATLPYRGDLLNSESLVVAIKLEIKHIGDTILRQKKYTSKDARREVFKQYLNILNDPTFSDFTFIVKGKSFKVHKAIIASASEIMRKMITTNLKESMQGECIVDNIEHHVFEHILHFIYAGEIPVNLGDVSMELFKAAHYYGITKLIEICKEDIHFRLSVENALEVCELATVYDIEDLKIDAWKIAKW